MDGPFAELHGGPLPLLLPNAWDVPSALAFVAAGYPAIGTTSLGVAASLGVPDGRSATREPSLALARALVRLPVLVSVDCEDGYSDDPAAAAAYVAALAELGVAGVNLEDSADGRLVEPDAFAAKVAAVKDAAPGVFVNARVDTYWFHQDESVEATVARASAYVEAGADGIFVPGLADEDAIREITPVWRSRSTCSPSPGGRWPTSPRWACAASAPGRCPTAPPSPRRSRRRPRRVRARHCPRRCRTTTSRPG